MNAVSILLLSLGLAMDATAVSVARGFSAQSIRVRDVSKTAVMFGGFQAAMPLLGWLLGDALGSLVAAWTHWIAFTVLIALGGKMLWDARSERESDDGRAVRPQQVFATGALVLLAVATSVDALAVGVTLPMLGAPLLFSLVSIGVVAAVSSAMGVIVGHRLGARFVGSLDAVGGLVLVLLGAKILAGHLGWL